MAAGDTATPSAAPKRLRLLPYFDAYVVGCHPRDLLFPGRAAERALAGSQAGNFPVLLIDGIAAGVWHQRRSGQKIAITVEPLEELTAAQRRELDEQVERIGEILEGKPQLTIGTVTVGAHARCSCVYCHSIGCHIVPSTIGRSYDVEMTRRVISTIEYQ